MVYLETMRILERLQSKKPKKNKSQNSIEVKHGVLRPSCTPSRIRIV